MTQTAASGLGVQGSDGYMSFSFMVIIIVTICLGTDQSIP